MRRREAMRAAYARKQRAKGIFWNKIIRTPIKRKPLKKISKSQRRRLEEYGPIRDAFLKQNPFCHICACLGEKPRPSTEVHHTRGRAGSLLCDVRFFAASCFPCRLIPHERIAWAREHDLIAPAHLWNVPAERENASA